MFIERVRTLDDAQRPIQDLVTSRIAAAIGQLNFADVLNTEQQRDAFAAIGGPPEAKRLGLVVQSIAIERLSLPIQNEQSILSV